MKREKDDRRGETWYDGRENIGKGEYICYTVVAGFFYHMQAVILKK